MKITKQSNNLLDFFAESPCIQPIPRKTPQLDNILTMIYNDIVEAYNYIGQHLVEPRVAVKEIETAHGIPYPSMFPAHSFPPDVRNHINITAEQCIEYTTNLLGRDITFYFVLEQVTHTNVQKYIHYAQNMLAWLYIVNQYAKSSCSRKLCVYIYMTSLTKNIPQSNISVLGESHANTAFTTTCPVNSEIIIFRKEEWFKSFIHETFHNFALDFSDMDNNDCHTKIKSLFPVDSKVNLFESYTEFWAEITNICLCSYLSLKNKSHVNEYLRECKEFMELEKTFGVFQMVKVLGYMGLTYKSLYSKDEQNETLRTTLYREETNILAYYIIKTILMVNADKFLEWCKTNNTSLMQFNKSGNNQNKFCLFIKNHYKSSKFLGLVKCNEEYIGNLINSRPKTKKDKSRLLFLLDTMRMTMCELG